ncbi:MAG TPA: hypothetical protein VHS97_05595 [Isosphaeraceae bacterium]|nr:hypothetical protein [Isosphaeraceae bacterium]
MRTNNVSGKCVSLGAFNLLVDRCERGVRVTAVTQQSDLSGAVFLDRLRQQKIADNSSGFRGLARGAFRMKEGEGIANLMRFSDIEIPEFVEHVVREFPDDCVLPDDRDFDRSVIVSTDVQATEQYQLAQARKVVRMYRAWEAAQN